jgi:hypothetical protein
METGSNRARASARLKDGRERDSMGSATKSDDEFWADPSLATLNVRAPTKECTLVVDNCFLGEIIVNGEAN